MHVPSHVRRGSVRFNMTPMIDVVFQLIIFFLVSSHLAKQESQMPLPLPTARSGNPHVESDVPRLTVNVQADGSLTLSGRHVPYAELTERLSDRLRDVGSTLEVRIRGDRNAPYQFIEPVLLSCARAGIWNVSFSVYRPEDAR